MRIILKVSDEKFLECSTPEQLIEKVQTIIKQEVYKTHPKQMYSFIDTSSCLAICPSMYSGVEIRAELEFPIQREWDF